MSGISINRREFLRVSLVLAGSALAASCQSQLPELTPTPKVPSGVNLHGGNADVWDYHKLVKGELKNPAACQSVWIRNGDTRLSAAVNQSTFSASVPIYPDANHLTAVCQRTDQEEELSSEITFTGRLPKRPTAIITATLANGHVILDGSGSLPDEVEQQPIREYFWSARPGNPEVVTGKTDQNLELIKLEKEITGTRLEVETPRIDGEYYFSLRLTDEAGCENTASTYLVVENGQARIPDYDRENPAWVEETIVYGVIPRQFGRPGARAIQDRLDDLADLGVNSMWLAPINATVDYGYSVTDYFELRKDFGTKEDFRDLVQAAHARGIRVLMDFVPNHTSNEHPYFKDTIEKGQASPYWDFYDRDAKGNYTYYFDWTHLPNLNYDNAEVRRMMIEAFSYWVREFDVDGFRVDACWGVKERRPDFWPEWRKELKRIKPDLFLLAEASARDPYYFDNGFDAAYDWTENLGNWSWARFWGEDAEKVEPAQMIESLKTMLLGGQQKYSPDVLIFRFLNNNDTGTRFITTHGEGLTRVATALLLTLPGIPCIYTGDEAGQWFRPYFDAAPISFRERYRGLRGYHKKLISLRKEIPSLHSRLWQLLEVEPADQALGYLRFLDGIQQPAMVLLNFSKESAQFRISWPEELSALVASTTWQDRLNDEKIAIGKGKVTLPAYGARILTQS